MEQVIYHVGMYLRLSMESNCSGSDSLENQREMIEEYVSRSKNMIMRKEYVDDGKTGTNFNRPAFLQMMDDAKQGLINCVIVKDLSRFGREYIETGNYMEKIFPSLGVRFIAIMDGYDSADSKPNQILLSVFLKNLMHEMYAKDISRKVKSTFEMKQEQRMFYRSVRIPYGYKMDPGDENYRIDEEAAIIVKKIFLMYHEGLSFSAIRNWLKENHIVPPSIYRKTGIIEKKEGEQTKEWELSTIKRILENPVYQGDILRHKTEQCLYEGKKTVSVPKNEQIVIKKNHPPIIDEKIFFSVQKRAILKRNGRALHQK